MNETGRGEMVKRDRGEMKQRDKRQDRDRNSEIALLFHPPTVVKQLGMVGLSFRLPTCLQNCSYPKAFERGMKK